MTTVVALYLSVVNATCKALKTLHNWTIGSCKTKGLLFKKSALQIVSLQIFAEQTSANVVSWHSSFCSVNELASFPGFLFSFFDC